MEDQNDPNRPRFAPQPVDVTKKSARRLHFDMASIKRFFTTRPTKKQLLTIGGGGIVVLLLGIGAIRAFIPPAPEPNPEPQVTSNYEPPKPQTIASPLTGMQVKPELAERPITGIMIENSIDARPQSGLRDAGVVFEAIAEGGITRFLTLFQEAQPDYIGPIRSARPYYVTWVAGFDAGYVHSGGSGEALALIANLGLKDMDHGQNAGYFDRVSNRYAPHNVYTSMARLDTLRSDKGYSPKSDFVSFIRVREDDDKNPAPSGTAATSISFDISSPLYNTSYTYDSESKTYPRIMANQPHLDERSGKQIAPRVIIALVTEYGIHPDGVHSVYRTTGTGKVLVFQDGVVIEGTWEKADEKASLSFKTKEGKALALKPGQTWITAIPDGRVSYTP